MVKSQVTVFTDVKLNKVYKERQFFRKRLNSIITETKYSKLC